MTVRNVGTVAVHGAILSLEVGGPSRPRRPWFRTRPHVVALLQPGETATLVVAPPPLGHGPRYVRANSAADRLREPAWPTTAGCSSLVLR